MKRSKTLRDDRKRSGTIKNAQGRSKTLRDDRKRSGTIENAKER
jgi:hypothetical protein